MRKIVLVGLLLLAVFLGGCQTWLRINLDLPILIEPVPYKAEVDGYLFYDVWTRHVRLAPSYEYPRDYKPLVDAKVTVLETGKVTYTDRNGYFFLRGVPYGKLTIVVEHRRLWDRAYFSVRSR